MALVGEQSPSLIPFPSSQIAVGFTLRRRLMSLLRVMTQRAENSRFMGYEQNGFGDNNEKRRSKHSNVNLFKRFFKNCPILFCKILECFVLQKDKRILPDVLLCLDHFYKPKRRRCCCMSAGFCFFFIHPSTEKLTQNCIFLPSGNLKRLQIPSECTGLLSCPSSGLL